MKRIKKEKLSIYCSIDREKTKILNIKMTKIQPSS